MTDVVARMPVPAHPVLASPDVLVRDYADRMFARQDRALPPIAFSVDWNDQPLRHTLRPGLPRRPLPSFARCWSGKATLPIALAGLSAPARLPSLAELAAALGTNSITGRRLGIDWNDDTFRRQAATGSTWSRPTPSGGGMYPVETYLVSQGQGDLPRGVYHYDTAHHGLVRLSRADRCPEIEAATSTASEAYLIATLRLWKNSFKYNSFCYHVVCQDAGALVCSWRLALGAQGIGSRPLLTFDQGGVSRALNLDPRLEQPVVVLPVGPPIETTGRGDGEHLGLSRNPLPVIEVSARPRSFAMVEHLVAATHTPSPDLGRVAVPSPAIDEHRVPALAKRINLPSGPTDRMSLRDAFLSRRSSFGRMSRARPMDLSSLAHMLRACSEVAQAPIGPADASGEPRLRTWVIAQSVAGLPAGAYAYDWRRHDLVVAGPADLAALQARYALQNYSTGQAAAMVVFSGRLDAMIEAHGAAGYRYLGIEVGQAAQAAYLSAAACGLGVGAVLGVDNLTVNDWLGLNDGDEQTMLFLFVGPERGAAAEYRGSLPATEQTRAVPASFNDRA